MTEKNQFTDPPIDPNYRSDEPGPGPNREPTVAPGIDTHNSLEAEPTEAERHRGDVTEVTRLYLDRTPDE